MDGRKNNKNKVNVEEQAKLKLQEQIKHWQLKVSKSNSHEDHHSDVII